MQTVLDKCRAGCTVSLYVSVGGRLCCPCVSVCVSVRLCVQSFSCTEAVNGFDDVIVVRGPWTSQLVSNVDLVSCADCGSFFAVLRR